MQKGRVMYWSVPHQGGPARMSPAAEGRVSDEAVFPRGGIACFSSMDIASRAE